jgi:hypothetical protein
VCSPLSHSLSTTSLSLSLPLSRSLFFSFLHSLASPQPMQSLCAAHPGVLSSETMIS